MFWKFEKPKLIKLETEGPVINMMAYMFLIHTYLMYSLYFLHVFIAYYTCHIMSFIFIMLNGKMIYAF